MVSKFKKFIRVTMCDVVLQFFVWFFFILFKEILNFELKKLMISCGILLFIFLLFYFFVFSRWVDKTNINNIKFHAVFLFNWLIMSVMIYFFITHLETSGLIRYCGDVCNVGGDEYSFFMISLVLLSIVIPIIYIFYLIFKPYKKVRTN